MYYFNHIYIIIFFSTQKIFHIMLYVIHLRLLADVGKKVKGDCETKMEESKDK